MRTFDLALHVGHSIATLMATHAHVIRSDD
jgi:hypothetical protein